MGSSLTRVFSQVGNGQLANDMEQEQLGLLEWETPSWDFTLFSLVFQTSFFLLTVVVLMNLLIAMMTNTYTFTNQLASEEYRLTFAKLVKEYFEITVLPAPLNILEHGLNLLCAASSPSSSTALHAVHISCKHIVRGADQTR